MGAMARAVSREVRRRLHRNVSVTSSSTTYRGVLWSSDREVVVLRQAEMLGPNGWSPVDGEMLLRWASIEFVQFADWAS